MHGHDLGSVVAHVEGTSGEAAASNHADPLGQGGGQALSTAVVARPAQGGSQDGCGGDIKAGSR